jgi:hypothetical protein
VTVGCVPKVPAGEGSWTATTAAAGTEVVAVVSGVDVEEAEELAEELLHPAKPNTDAVITTRDQVRRRDIEDSPFGRDQEAPVRWAPLGRR